MTDSFFTSTCALSQMPHQCLALPPLLHSPSSAPYLYVQCHLLSFQRKEQRQRQSSGGRQYSPSRRFCICHIAEKRLDCLEEGGGSGKRQLFKWIEGNCFGLQVQYSSEGHWVFMMLAGYMFCHHTWHHPAHFQDMVVMMPLYLTNKPRQELLLRIRLYMNDITPVMGSVWCCSSCMLPAAMACMQKYVLLCPHAVKFVTSLISIATSDVIWRLNLHCTQVVGTRQHVWLFSKILP